MALNGLLGADVPLRNYPLTLLSSFTLLLTVDTTLCHNAVLGSFEYFCL